MSKLLKMEERPKIIGENLFGPVKGMKKDISCAEIMHVWMEII